MGMVEQLSASFVELGKDVAFLLRSVSNKLDDAEGSVRNRHFGAKPARTVLANLKDGYDLPSWNGMVDLRSALGFQKDGETIVATDADISGDYNAASNLVVHDTDGEARIEVLSASGALAVGAFFGRVGESSVAAIRYFFSSGAVVLTAPAGELLRVADGAASGKAVLGTGLLMTEGSYGLGETSLRDNVIADADARLPTGTYGTTNLTAGTFPAEATTVYGTLEVRAYDNDGWEHQTYWPNSGPGHKTGWRRSRNGAAAWGTWTSETRVSSGTDQTATLASGTVVQSGIVTASTGGSVTWTYPSAFASAPNVVAVCVDAGNPRTVTIGTPTATSVEVSAWKADGTRSAAPVHLMAIGE